MDAFRDGHEAALLRAEQLRRANARIEELEKARQRARRLFLTMWRGTMFIAGLTALAYR